MKLNELQIYLFSVCTIPKKQEFWRNWAVRFFLFKKKGEVQDLSITVSHC